MMACGCKKNGATQTIMSETGCRFCMKTSVWWAPHKSCYAWRCSNPLMLTDPPPWAFGNTRRATEDDSLKGAIISDANYIAVRSCFCRCEKCPHYQARESK